MADSSNKHLNFAAPCFKPSANSSFRIDDILVKSDAIGKRSFADLKRLEQNEESGDSGLKKAKKATEQQTSDAPETSHGSSASLLSTLSSFYDMHSYHPGVSMLMKNSSTFQSLYNGLNLDNTSAVKAALALSSSFNSLALLSNPTGNDWTSSPTASSARWNWARWTNPKSRARLSCADDARLALYSVISSWAGWRNVSSHKNTWAHRKESS